MLMLNRKQTAYHTQTKKFGLSGLEESHGMKK